MSTYRTLAQRAAVDAFRVFDELGARAVIAVMQDRGGVTETTAYRNLLDLDREGVLVSNGAHSVDARTYRLAGQGTR
jgi:hypothetical protein